MLIFINLLIINFTLIIIGLGLLFIFTILLILFLLNQKKNKKLYSDYHKLNEEVNHLKKSEAYYKPESPDQDLALKIKNLNSEIKKHKAAELQHKIALKDAEESNFLRNTFLANMSLEIRTPLNGIIGFSRLLLKEVEYQEKPELIDFAKGISESSIRLLNLMEHIIDLSRIDTNDYDIQLKAFDVNSVIHESIEKTKIATSQKNLVLNYKPSQTSWALGDKAAFEKSLDLILDNAIAFTTEGSVTIDLSEVSNKNTLQIRISDTGIGIDKGYLSNIFQAFRQESTGFSRAQKGAGLGLPLAHKLMRLMKGDLRIESEKNKGTVVSLFLDLDPKSLKETTTLLASDDQKIEKKISDSDQPYIFIVEDDKMNRLLFKKMLADYADIRIAIDGEDAFKQLEDAIQSNLIFDIILLDISLPEPWDGLLLLEEFKKRWPILNNIPFVAQTAFALSGDKERFLAAGFDDYISKPIDKKELFTIIENNLQKFGAQRDKQHEKHM